MAQEKIEIVLGTNEEYILGYSLHIVEDGKITLHQDFADHSHIGSVRQVAIGGRFLASGGTDEHIKVFDIKNQKEVGTLMQHEGTVTHLGFHKSKDLYLFSASEDGKICIFNSNKWICEKTLKGHKAGVVSVSIHPSGKIALSVGRDKKLRTWDLIKGRKAYITHIDSTPDIVLWSPSAEHFVIVKGSYVDLYDVTTCKVKNTVNFKESISALLFITDDIIAVAAGDKNICFYDISNQIEIFQWEAHTMRVKCLRLVLQDDAEEPWLVSASSDGYIKVWKLQLLSLTNKPALMGEVDTTCRIICMDVYIPSSSSKLDRIEQILKKKSQQDTESAKLKKKKKKDPLAQDEQKFILKKKKSSSSELGVNTLKFKKKGNIPTHSSKQIAKKKKGNAPAQDVAMVTFKKKRENAKLKTENGELPPQNLKKIKLKKKKVNGQNIQTAIKKKRRKQMEMVDDSVPKKKKLKMK